MASISHARAVAAMIGFRFDDHLDYKGDGGAICKPVRKRERNHMANEAVRNDVPRVNGGTGRIS